MGINTEKDTCERSVTFSNVENSTEIPKAVMLMNFFRLRLTLYLNLSLTL